MTEKDNLTEETAATGAESTDAPEFQALREDFEKFKDLYIRSQADLDNYRKRAAREREDSIRYANSSLLERLLPILDNFELGLDAAKNTPGAENILMGLGMVQKQLQDFLKDSGIEPVEAVGAEFDPNLHEAIGQEPSAEVAENIVLRQLRRGYKLRDRLLRPATVIVSKGNLGAETHG
jgi:molecular chaperone GrpE